MAPRAPDHVDRVLAQWRAVRPDLELGAMGTLSRLWRFGRLADRRVDEEFARHGLQRGWFDVLATLRRAGDPYELTPTELMASAMLSSGGMTKRIDRLAAAGLVQRAPDPDDRRGVRVRLTRAGLAITDRVVDAHVRNEEELLAPLTASERATLDRLLRKLLDGVT